MVEINGIIAFFIVMFLLWIIFRRLPNRDAPIDNIRRSFSRDELAKVILKDNGKCQHCGSDNNINIDHIKPLNKGGHNGLKNLQILCGKCNSKKGDRFIG